MKSKRNIFSDIPGDIPRESFQDILTTDHFKIQRIVSKGHSSPKGFWYDQDQSEWVILLKGRAGLMFHGEKDVVELEPGDYILIPPHLKHRVEWTDPNTETVWLAIMFG